MDREKTTLNRDTFQKTYNDATAGGTRRATYHAEEKIRQGLGLDPMVDPKGPPHLGPVRLSLPRFVKVGNFWRLSNGLPMAVESLLDTTGSMGDNVKLAIEALLKEYEMLTVGENSIMKNYDLQIATGIFNDTKDNEDDGKPVFCRTQFEMAEEIARQMACCPPGKNGKGNGKEDPQFGLFAAAFLTMAFINRYGLKTYHFTVSDEPLVMYLDPYWIKEIFGNDVMIHVKKNGHNIDLDSLPDTSDTVKQLQKSAHAFFLQVGDRRDVKEQWTNLYGEDYVIMLPEDSDGYQTKNLHCVKSVIIGLTEGVLDLKTAVDFLREHEVSKADANKIVRAVAHIPIGAQKLCENFGKLPKAGDFFRNKTDLWPVDPIEINAMDIEDAAGGMVWED